VTPKAMLGSAACIDPSAVAAPGLPGRLPRAGEGLIVRAEVRARDLNPGHRSLWYRKWDNSSESMMTVDRQPNELEPSAQKILGAPRARKGGTLAAFVLLAIVGAAASYGWLNYDGLAQTVFSAARPATAQPVDDKEKVPLEDFQAFQKQTADSLQSANANLVAQKADLERLSEQVSALSTRLDAMQSAASKAPPQQAAPARPPVSAARKKPSAASAGPISVGGSPLPPNPADDH